MLISHKHITFKKNQSHTGSTEYINRKVQAKVLLQVF